MDPITALGAASSVIQLVQVGAQLSIQFYTIAKQIKNAPRVFEEISNEVASTSTILQLLSSELDDHSRIQLHKPAAVQKTRELMAECGAIYETLAQKITPNVKDGASDRAKARAALMKRLKLPYMAEEFSELRNRLMGVKTWLNMMLSTLNLGVQAKGFSGSQEAKDLLMEQRQMLEMLVLETRLLREKADQSSQTLGSGTGKSTAGVNIDKEINTAVLSSVNAFSISRVDSATTLINTEAAKDDPQKNSQTQSFTDNIGQKGIVLDPSETSSLHRISSNPTTPLPKELALYAKEIREQARLITDLGELIDQKSYSITRKTRTSMHDLTLDAHLQRWKGLAQKHGYNHVMSMVEGFPDLLDIWQLESLEGSNETRELELSMGSSRDPASKSEAPVSEPVTPTTKSALLIPAAEHKVAEELLPEIRETFDLFDYDKDGYLRKEDLRTLWAVLGPEPTEQEIFACLTQAGVEDHNRIAFNEFVRMIEIQPQVAAEEAAVRAETAAKLKTVKIGTEPTSKSQKKKSSYGPSQTVPPRLNLRSTEPSFHGFDPVSASSEFDTDSQDGIDYEKMVQRISRYGTRPRLIDILRPNQSRLTTRVPVEPKSASISLPNIKYSEEVETPTGLVEYGGNDYDYSSDDDVYKKAHENCFRIRQVRTKPIETSEEIRTPVRQDTSLSLVTISTLDDSDSAGSSSKSVVRETAHRLVAKQSKTSNDSDDNGDGNEEEKGYGTPIRADAPDAKLIAAEGWRDRSHARNASPTSETFTRRVVRYEDNSAPEKTARASLQGRRTRRSRSYSDSRRRSWSRSRSFLSEDLIVHQRLRMEEPSSDEEEESDMPDVSKDVESLLREYTMLDEDELKMLG